MAERRMFAKTIIDSDAFLEMPISARLLYYDLAMRADDDGFIHNPKSVMRACGGTEDDLRILISKKSACVPEKSYMKNYSTRRKLRYPPLIPRSW